jgi:cytochrome P450
MIYQLVLVVAAFIGYLLFSEYRRNKGLPPGPPRLPLIGNLHQAPTEVPWRKYQEWTKQYGPIFSLQFGLSTVIMLGTHESAHELLDKRSGIYSSRPRLVMAGECVTKGLHVLLQPYGGRWRAQQRVQASCLNIRVSQTYKPVQDLESKQLVFELLTDNNFAERFHRYTASLMFGLAYGKRSLNGDDYEIKMATMVNENMLYAGRVGTWIVDSLPILNYLPKPLAPWKKLADKFYKLESGLHRSNMNTAQQTSSWNWTKQVMNTKEAQQMSPMEAAYALGIMYEAGIDTTNMALEVFILAAVLNADFVKTAQKQLDDVVGSDRLPTFEDEKDLPYITSVVKEVLRWRPVSAGGIPHAVIQNDTYMGYRIPKGATVIGNHWSIHMDENVFAEPKKFRPERWLEDPDLPLHAFGFGRRVCTGQHVSTNSMFIIIARLLWTFNFKHAQDESGRKIEIDDMAFTSGFNSRPQPFKVNFEVRDVHRRLVVQHEWASANKDLNMILDGVQKAQVKSG